MPTNIATDCAGEPAMARVGALVTGKLLDSQVVCLWVPLIIIPIPSSHPHSSHHHQFHAIPLPLLPQSGGGGAVWVRRAVTGISGASDRPSSLFRPPLGVSLTCPWRWVVGGRRAEAEWRSADLHPWPYPRLFRGPCPSARLRRSLLGMEDPGRRAVD